MGKNTYKLVGGIFLGIGALAYLTLFILGLVVLGIAYWKIKSFRLFILYFSVAGIILFFDYLIYVWGEAYIYKPGILDGKFDTHLGAMINGQILPSFAVLFIVMRWKWYWSIPLALFFTLIELLFTEWGIFEAYWWSPWYTLVGIFILFPIARLWWSFLQKKWIRFGTLLLSFYAIFIPLHFLLNSVLKMRTYHVEWIEQLNRDSSSVFTSITCFIFGTILCYLCITHGRDVWFHFVVFGYIAYDFLLKYFGIAKAENTVFDSILSFLFFFLGYLFVRYANSKIKKLVNDS